MKNDLKTAVVLLNLGGPDSLDAVEPFLFNLFNDPEIINFPFSFLFRKKLAKIISVKRAPKIQQQYEKIGGKSPILDITSKQAALLENSLQKKINAKVFIAMRYWKPFTEETVIEVNKFSPDIIVLLPLYPQFSTATTGSSVKEWNRLIKSQNILTNVPVKVIENYHLNDLYIDSFIERIYTALKKFPADKLNDVTVLFSAHGTPVKLVKQCDPYSFQIRETVEKIVKKGKISQNWELCFQSKVGPQKWLTPSTPSVIEEKANEGVKYLLMVPVAFTSDHLETLFELNIEYRHLAGEKGINQFEMTEGLNDSPHFISALENLVLENISGYNSVAEQN